MSSNGNDSLTSSYNDIYFLNDDNNFKKELIKVLEEGLKEISGRLYSIEVKIEKGLKNSKISQGEIRCFRNSEMLRKPDGSKFRHVSAGRIRRETCKLKMEALFRVSAALPLT